MSTVVAVNGHPAHVVVKKEDIDVGQWFYGEIQGVHSLYLKAYGSTIVDIKDPKRVWMSGSPDIRGYSAVDKATIKTTLV